MEAIDIGTLSVQAPIIWTHFVIEDWIVYAGGGGRQRQGHETPRTLTLPSYLAQVGGPPGRRIEDVPALLEALLDFYRAFGFLAPVERPLLRRTRGRRRRFIRSSESIAWALRHAWNVQTIIALHHATEQKDAAGRLTDDRLEALLAGFTRRHPVTVRRMKLAKGERQPRRPWHSVLPDADHLDTRRLVMVPGPREDDGLQPLHLARSAGESALAFSRRIIDALLTPNLIHIRRRYDPVEGVPRFVGEYLIDAVYWQLANDLKAGDLRQCPCGQLFFAQDKRQKHCPPLPGRRESRCGQRFRMRNKRRVRGPAGP